jgi:hypothetical protein
MVLIGNYAGRYNTLSNIFAVDNTDRGNSATEITNSILYGVMAATVAGQSLRINANVQTFGRKQAVAIKSADYTLGVNDEVVVFTANATATLPASTGSGQTYRIICRAGILTIDGNSTDTIIGELTQTLTAGENLILTDTASGIWE